MSDSTKNFNFQYINQNQTGKETLLNSNFNILDKILLGGAKSFTVTTNPANPQDGDLYIIPTNATGQWSGKSNYITIFDSNYGWLFFYPKAGTLMFALDVNHVMVFNSSNIWVKII